MSHWAPHQESVCSSNGDVGLNGDDAALEEVGISVGNAADGLDESYRGWFVGSFVPSEQGLARNDLVKVKWGHHRRGEQRPSLSERSDEVTLSLLVQGHFVLEFPEVDKEIELNRPSDYVVFPGSVRHSWRSSEDSIVLTVRWRQT